MCGSVSNLLDANEHERGEGGRGREKERERGTEGERGGRKRERGGRSREGERGGREEERGRDRQRQRQTDRQTDRQTETERQTDRDRQTETETYPKTPSPLWQTFQDARKTLSDPSRPMIRDVAMMGAARKVHSPSSSFPLAVARLTCGSSVWLVSWPC